MTQEPTIRRTPTVLRTLALVSVLALVVAACGGPAGGGGGGDATGNLRVTVTGLPAGTAADVDVTGPAGYGQALTASTTLSALAVGTYAVGAEAVSAGLDVGTYDPVEPSQSAAVIAATTTTSPSSTTCTSAWRTSRARRAATSVGVGRPWAARAT